MKCVILAGGLGTRLSEETNVIPKPMIQIGSKPILWHIMKHYYHYDIDEFYLALGYKSDIIKRYFHDIYSLDGSITVDLKSNQLIERSRNNEKWVVHLEETGLNTMTGGRLKRLEPFLKTDKKPFCLTYGDGVCDINIKQVVDFHKKKGKIATVTAVRPPARFGEIKFNSDGTINSFIEKPQVGEGWINGGFFVFEPEIFDYITDDTSILESQVLEALAKEKQLVAYTHDGFWQCMDTLRDKRLLEQLWNENKAPWKTW
ncbi:MAG: Glucose-1-phosphate cytidylyltransferase [uncultured bacterium]|nr:MAG: Glucose-1-phosphate cytidylyltransferase [uncultured bacterium]OFW68607.1 MAG: glucose-1-phosphate cytidylyltransferase [Alphaproteobacteria bacterium GWC2_42_16]OFW73214.1 MAG: glucose-1-phosphate cytidylyltransferase [Alphaproteobacteria bacterium GWA2_41_27]OFW81605.1 MAG: glucose-1-phosphate cytidylyltransferase [Alphaproteobacteria bacterium RIFCSPHIGHO2_12_FULL_42_100]OFW85069.1 MAG: glucose-1-phosphate cytidylyltransferase [Alphaproteobacteria bacterium RBG_16_42_14]OFW90519.1 M